MNKKNELTPAQPVQHHRRSWQSGVILAVAALLLGGCPASKTGSNGPTTPERSADRRVTGNTGARAALAIDIAGVDDKSFNAASWSGLQRARTELGMGEGSVKYVEAREVSDYKTNLAAFASQNYDLVFAGSYAFADALKEVAPQFPKVKFAIIDGDAPNLPNCASLQFRSQEGTYLAGYLAASMSKTRTIGFVGGKEIPIIKTFEAGYIAGAKTADPRVKVLRTYTGDWNDVSKGKSQATQQFANGADIVFHAAGKAGLGVIQATREKGAGFYAIGVDQNQDAIAPGRVLTSVLKRVDVATFDTVKRVNEGRFTPGKRVYGLKDGGVALTEMKYTRKNIPAAVLARLEKLSRMVAEGRVVPPSTPEAAAAFQAPKM